MTLQVEQKIYISCSKFCSYFDVRAYDAKGGERVYILCSKFYVETESKSSNSL